MPLLDIAKEHLSTGLRLPRRDEIAYFLVGPQEDVGISVPALLRNPALTLIGSLPKSGLQLICPLPFLIETIAQGEPQPVRFGVVFESNFSRWCEHETDEPALARVLFWSSTYSPAAESLAKLDGRIVFPINGEARANLLSAGVPPEALVATKAELIAVLKQRAMTAFAVVEGDLLERRRASDETAEDFHRTRFCKEILPFAPAYVNLNQIQQIFGRFQEGYWNPSLKNDFERRPSFLKSSFEAVADVLTAIREYEVNGEAKRARMPASIFAFPSIGPALKENFRRGLLDVPPEYRSLFKSVAGVRLLEQDTCSYSNNIKPRLRKDLDPLAIQIGATESAAYTHYLDEVGYLHSSFWNAPYLRAPMKGESLIKLHSRFSPTSFATNATGASTHKLIERFSAKLRDAIPTEVRELLLDYPGGFVALSDLPVEWISCDGVPMCFLQDLCRIPETVPSNLMAQFARNRHTRYEVTPDLPGRTLVICGAPAADPISRHFDLLTTTWKERNARWRWAYCHSIDSLVAEVIEFKPELLIFDTHGRFERNKTGTQLQLGTEWLDGRAVLERLPQIPLVMMSTCWGAPLYGCPNTIAHAFFEKGSISVTTSMLPLNIFKGGMLYTRVLNNLERASSVAVHHNWSSFMSHNIRTSFFDDLKYRAASHVPGLDVDDDAYINLRSKWQISTMHHQTRPAAFREAVTTLSACYPEEKRDRLAKLLHRNDFVPEFMYYSVMGRADLVQFRVWNDANHQRNPFSNKLSDFVNSDGGSATDSGRASS